MSIMLSETHKDITENDCVQYAQELTKSSVDPVPWQGCHSYTLLSKSGVIVQFRSQESPFDIKMTTLARQTHGRLAPTTTYEGTMTNSTITVWVMEALPGVGYLCTDTYTTVAKQDVIVIDLARFFAASWNNAQGPDKEKNDLYYAQLTELSDALPERFSTVIQKTKEGLNEILNTRWVLTHQDLSDKKILVNPDSGHLTGVVDWADACIEPFGKALWGLESILGRHDEKGYSYFGGDASRSQTLFRETLLKEIKAPYPVEAQKAIDEARTLGVLLRWGYRWEEGSVKPTSDTSMLEISLEGEFSGLVDYL